ncbi:MULTISPECIES: gp16 family protein [Snodgrassella]|uniref:gp16 family protein n=1 Tax=Snodgrassella TaxID=1193515 RepID=UPI0008161286|nr:MULTISPECIES: phage protein GemA/Gp16 family protein [Snodgrassella]MCO6520886.1 DUF1018 domain-containing protein [Snodgrassella sp.]SCC12920.1 Mu-like prophage protein gp16 [Snodgrassella sp. R-53583]
MNKHNRNSMIAKIKIAQQQLCIEDSAYRALLVRLTGKSSSTQMNQDELECVIREMCRLGFKPTKPKRYAAPNHRKSNTAMIGKVAALLADNKLPWNYAHKLAKHMFGVDRVQWLNDWHLHKLIAALQIHADRRYEEYDPCHSKV